MKRLMNGQWRTNNRYETGALALYCIAKAGEGVAESIIREIIPQFADEILEKDDWRMSTLLFLEEWTTTLDIDRSLEDDGVDAIICEWLKSDDLIIQKEDRDTIAQAIGYLCLDNVWMAIQTMKDVV